MVEGHSCFGAEFSHFCNCIVNGDDAAVDGAASGHLSVLECYGGRLQLTGRSWCVDVVLSTVAFGCPLNFSLTTSTIFFSNSGLH